MGLSVNIIKAIVVFGMIFSLIMWINYNVKAIVEKHHLQQIVNWSVMLAVFITIGYFIFKL